jgi:voltage-gated potassium channel
MSTEARPETGSAYAIFVLAISILSLVLLTVMTAVRLDDATRKILEGADLAICLIFFIDFAISLARAPRKSRYFATWGWLDLLSSVPVINHPAVGVLRLGRLSRIVRILRVLRGVRSARMLASFILRRRAQSTLLAALLLALLLIACGSVAILHVENRPDANITGPGDAIWWTFVTLATVGESGRFPVTTEGRAIAGVLMLGGIGLIGVLTGYFASWFLAPGEREQEDELEALRRELRELRRILESGRAGPGA